MTLHLAIKILVNPDLCLKDNDYAKALLKCFVRNCKLIYGNTFMSYNVHCLIHLADDVKYHGLPLDMMSCFTFENYLRIFLKLVRKHEKPLLQIVRRLQEIFTNTRYAFSFPNKYSCISLNGIHIDGTLCGLVGKQHHEIHIKGCALNSNRIDDNHIFLKNYIIVKVFNFIQTGNGIYIVGKQYSKFSNLYVPPCESSRLRIYSVSPSYLSELKYWPLSRFKCKALTIPIESGRKFAVFPLFFL